MGPAMVVCMSDVVAGMAGTTRPTLNRILKQAEAEGIIGLGRGRIEVLDRTRLEKMAGRF